MTCIITSLLSLKEFIKFLGMEWLYEKRYEFFFFMDSIHEASATIALGWK